MISGKPSLFWPLRVVVAITLIAPALLLIYATWQSSRSIDRQANERIERALDVLQEHALKAFQTVERSLAEIDEVLRDVSEDAIRAGERDFHLRFKRTQQALPQIESIWAFDRHGHPLASSTILPVPPELDNSDRSYFRAQRERNAGTYVGEVVKAKIGGSRFFVMSVRRQAEGSGRFEGVIAVTVMPAHFTEFYRKLSRGQDSFTMLRSDGVVLARFPETVADAPRADQLSESFRQQPEQGILTAISPIDGKERLAGYRKVAGFDVYVVAGIETAALRQEFWSTLAFRAAVGLPVVLFMFGLALHALRRAERFEREARRRETAEAALKQAQRLEAIGQLTGGVAHDFNNLLMVVQGNADRLKRHISGSERADRALAAIDIAVKRGAELTRQLLSFSRRQTHEARVVDFGERLPSIRAMLQSSLRGDITVEVRLGEGLWYAKVDLSEFELAMLNLAVNARDAMRAGGKLTISAENATLIRPNAADLDGPFVAVTVQDTGEGIAPEIVGRVFEPFFTTKDVGKGTGLGLSQVYGFARQAGGAAVLSSRLGEGTSVTLFLPRSTEPPHQDTPEPSSGPAVQTGGRIRVLLVEDNDEVADVTYGLLAGLGFDVARAPDVATARAELSTSRERFDIVLSDIVMPGGANGLDLARWIRQQFGPRLPVVLATGYSDKAQAATNEGFTILRKPYDASTLHALLTEALRGPVSAPVA